VPVIRGFIRFLLGIRAEQDGLNLERKREAPGGESEEASGAA
jgi:hypothetical protein